MPPAAPIDLRTKLAHGLGMAGGGIKRAAFGVFLLFYFHQVLGLPGALAGLALFLALCLDAVTGPLVGWLSDCTRSRWGRRHPFMYAAGLPMAACFYLLFSPPAGLGEVGLFAWLLGFASAVHCSLTLFQIPSAAMTPELTADYDERTTILSYRHLFGRTAALATSASGYLYFFAPSARFPRGQLDPAAYPAFALCCAVAAFTAIVVSAAGTHRMIPRMSTAAAGPRRPGEFARAVRQILAVPSYRALLLAAASSAVAHGFLGAVTLYVRTYFWGFSTAEMFLIGLGLPAAVLAAVVAAPRLVARSDKRTTALRLAALATLVGPAPIALRLLGLMPANGTLALLLAIATHATTLTALEIGLGIVTASMLADVADEGELRSGSRQEGMFASATALASKAGTGLGSFLAGATLDAIAFAGGTDPGQVPAGKVLALGAAVAPSLFALSLVTLYCLTRYRISRERQAQIRSELGGR